jgi:hypothetical protein
LLPELESPEVVEAAGALRSAIQSIWFDDVDVIVLLTPHAPAPGVYRAVRGDLGAFGVPGIAVEARTHEGLIETLGKQFLDASADHGVAVPLRIGRWPQPVVAVGVGAGERLTLECDERVAVVASVNGSTGLSARAPFTVIPGADDVERRFAEAIEEDLRRAAAIDLPGSCGAEVVTAFAETLDGRPAKVLAHEAPVGVGYLVAEVR